MPFVNSSQYLLSVIDEFIATHRNELREFIFNVPELQKAGFTRERLGPADNPDITIFILPFEIQVISVKEAVLDGARFTFRGFTGVPDAYAKGNIINITTLSAIPYAIPEASKDIGRGAVVGKLRMEFEEDEAMDVFDDEFSNQADTGLDIESKDALIKNLLHEYFHATVARLLSITEEINKQTVNESPPDAQKLLGIDEGREEELATEFAEEFFFKLDEIMDRRAFKNMLVIDLVETDWRRINKGEKAAYPKVVEEYNNIFG